MSRFMKLLKCILCVDDEERKVSRDWRQHEYQRLSSADSHSSTPPTHSTLRSPSNFAKIGTRSEIANKYYGNSMISQSTQNRESIHSNSVPSRNVVEKSSTKAMDPCNKVPAVSSQFNYPSSMKPPSATAKATLSVVPTKPNHIASSSSSGNVHQTTKVNQVLNKVSRQSSPDNVTSASSRRSQPSSDLSSYVQSFKSPSVTTKSAPEKATLSVVPTKPNQITSSSSSGNAHQTTKVNQVLNKVSRQSSPNNVTSASSQRSQPSSDLSSYVQSFKSPSVTNKSAPSLLSEKSSQCSHKPKDLHLSSSNYNSHESMPSNGATNKGTDHKFCSCVYSVVSKPSQSSPKFPLFPGSSKLDSPAYDTEKRSPIPKKDPQLPTSQKSKSPKPPPLSSKPTLSHFSSSSTGQQKKNNYVWVEKSASTTYVFPLDIKRSIEKGIAPQVLRMPLSPTTYKDYFHALLCAEDCHLEKWEGFEVKNVILELHDATIYAKKGNSKRYNAAVDKDEKLFIVFDIDKILEKGSSLNEKCEGELSFYVKRERRPFLLSRDFVFVKPTDSNIKPFQGIIYRVVKSSLVLVEFGESFHSQHDPENEYDVKFSFNRVCLKRAHHALTTASETLYRNFLFPDFASKQELTSKDLSINHGYPKESFAIHQILRLQGAPPYLIEGPLSVVQRDKLSRTATVIVEAVVQICRISPSNRVLLCAPLNKTCDVLMRALKRQMDESDIFRANAAFREVDGVPLDILPSCLYEEEMDCFACPSLEELKKYKVITSTFMSSFRLRDEGMVAGHFSHIFLVDASSVTEPEATVPLANFANSKSIVVVTGAPGNRSGWVRSMIARDNGLKISYFERLQCSELYDNLDPRFITQLEDHKSRWF